MNPADLTPDCERLRGELCAYLYQELAAEARASVERHLKVCAGCRDELATLGETRKLLELWETPPVEDDPWQLAQAIVARARSSRRPRARLVRLGALVTGAAAALLVAACLFGTEAELEQGRLRLSFGLPGARPADGSPLEPELESRMRTIAAQEVSSRGAELQQGQAQLLQRFSQLTQEELLRVTQAVDLAMAENRRVVNTNLANFKREADVNDLAQREAIQNLVTYLRPVSNPNR